MTIAPERRIYLVNVADLLRRPGSHRDIEFAAPVHSIAVVDSAVPEGAEAHVQLKLEALSDGLTVTGTSFPLAGSLPALPQAAEGELCAEYERSTRRHP